MRSRNDAGEEVAGEVGKTDDLDELAEECAGEEEEAERRDEGGVAGLPGGEMRGQPEQRKDDEQPERVERATERRLAVGTRHVRTVGTD